MNDDPRRMFTYGVCLDVRFNLISLTVTRLQLRMRCCLYGTSLDPIQQCHTHLIGPRSVYPFSPSRNSHSWLVLRIAKPLYLSFSPSCLPQKRRWDLIPLSCDTTRVKRYQKRSNLSRSGKGMERRRRKRGNTNDPIDFSLKTWRAITRRTNALSVVNRKFFLKLSKEAST